MSYDGYMDDLKETMELVQGSLQTIVREQKKELEGDEEYQRQFYKLCNDIGVDPFAQKKGLFSGLFKKDLNDFYRKLGIRVLAYCNKTRFQNGGLIRVSDIEAYLNKHSTRGSEKVYASDIRVAVEKMKVLSPSLRFFETAGNDGTTVEYLQSSDVEFTEDAMRVFSRAQLFDGKVQHSDIGIEDKWKRELKNLAEKGLAWIDTYEGEHTYYFPAIYFADKQ